MEPNYQTISAFFFTWKKSENIPNLAKVGGGGGGGLTPGVFIFYKLPCSPLGTGIGIIGQVDRV